MSFKFQSIAGIKPVSAAFVLLFSCFVPSYYANAIEVITTIEPLHSLTSSVMKGVGEPRVLVSGNQSPHTFSLRPSDARSLEGADVVFYIERTLESSLVGPIETLASDALVVELAVAEGVTRLPFREDGDFAHDSHDDHDHEREHEHSEDESDDHGDEHEHGEDESDHHGDEHGHGEDESDDHGDEHGHDEEESDHHEDEHGHGEDESDGHEGHGHGEFDAHIWLDPLNAVAMVRAIADALSEADPDNAQLYQSNAKQMMVRLHDLSDQVAADLESVHDVPFIVFHDAYQYFERRFGLNSVGAVTVSPERPPGVKRVRALQSMIHERGIVCVFDEPQFNRKVVELITEGTQARIGTIDPLGAIVEDGPEFYSRLILNMAKSFKDCLSGQG